MKVVRRRLYSSILTILLGELKEKFPNSLKIYLLECYIHASIVRSSFNCLNRMRCFSS